MEFILYSIVKMDPLLHGAGIYGRFITAEELPIFCRHKLDKTVMPSWEQKILNFIINFLDSSDHIVQESSGTTGKPKKIHLSKYSMIRSALQTAKKFNLEKGHTAMLCLPVDYIAGKMMILRTLVTGMDLVWIEPSACPAFPGNKTFDIGAMVPLQVCNLIEKERSFSCIKNLLIGGSELSSELENQLKKVPSRIYETFGMAETCSHIALRRINGPSATPWFTAMPGIKISVDLRGCLMIEASFLKDRVITNDVVEIMRKKRFLWKGRVDNLINSGGIKISPEHLEKMIVRILGHESYVVGLPDKKLGHKLVMVTTHPCSSAEKKIMRNALRNRLPSYHLPAEIIVLRSFPRNRFLKIDRARLHEETVKQAMKS
jgi:o-succinylbenzoate---CoA ligase